MGARAESPLPFSLATPAGTPPPPSCAATSTSDASSFFPKPCVRLPNTPSWPRVIWGCESGQVGAQPAQYRNTTAGSRPLLPPPRKRRRRRDFSRRLHGGSALISRILCPRCPSAPGCDHLSVRLIAQPAPACAVERLLPGGIHPLRDLRPGGPFSCSVLHRMRFVVPPSSRLGRWALTPPFHPYPRLRAGGLFSVILSVTAACTAAPTLSCGMLPYGVRTFLWHLRLAAKTPAITPADPR